MSVALRFLITNTIYPEFLLWLYAQHPGLEKQLYEEQMGVVMASLFGVADFYSSNLRKLGHEAWDIHANNEWMQKAWAREQGMKFYEPTPVQRQWEGGLRRARRLAGRTPLRYLKPLFGSVPRSLDSRQSWFYDILAAQVKHYKPDVLLNQSMRAIGSDFLKETKPYVRLLVGQHAATRLSDAEDFSCYDLVVSSFPPTVEYFYEKGIPAEMNRLGFEPRVLSCLAAEGKASDVTFIGSFHGVHGSRVALLEYICARFPNLRIWSPAIEHLPPASPIRGCYEGRAWGQHMYQILRDSRITLNHHGEIAPYANNMRLYEATGVGTMLLTDWKENLHEMFEPGKEVVAYRTPEECAELTTYYLEHEDERKAIARAGQERTLRDHTYSQRMRELVAIARKYL